MSVPNVLVVEDNPADADLIREQLLDESLPDRCTVDHVSCLADAILRLDERKADLVLLDLGLPDSHGLDTVRRTIMAAKDVPVVVLSGMNDEQTVYQAMQAQADDFLVKGLVDRRQLLRTLARARAKRHQNALKAIETSTEPRPSDCLPFTFRRVEESQPIVLADQDEARLLTMNMLLRMHCFVTETCAVDELSVRVAKARPQLVLVGLSPLQDPAVFEVLAELRVSGATVVAVIPKDHIALEQRALQTGINGVLYAPIRYEQLGDWVESVICD